MQLRTLALTLARCPACGSLKWRRLRRKPLPHGGTPFCRWWFEVGPVNVFHWDLSRYPEPGSRLPAMPPSRE